MVIEPEKLAELDKEWEMLEEHTDLIQRLYDAYDEAKRVDSSSAELIYPQLSKILDYLEYQEPTPVEVNPVILAIDCIYDLLLIKSIPEVMGLHLKRRVS